VQILSNTVVNSGTSGAFLTVGGAQQNVLTLKNSLVVLQVAVSVVLLGGTGIFLQMLSASRTVRTGYAIDGVAMIETDARYAGYSATEARNAFEEIRRRVAAIPGVQAAVLTRGLQTDGARVVVEGATAAAGPDDVSRVGVNWAGPGYFDTLRIPILFGRALDERDRHDAPRVAVISETMARQYFGAGNAASAVGRRFRLERDTDANAWIEELRDGWPEGATTLTLVQRDEPRPTHLLKRGDWLLIQMGHNDQKERGDFGAVHVAPDNSGAVPVFVTCGEATVVATLAASMPVVPGTVEVIGCSQPYVAAITTTMMSCLV
jgi:hypothetical protein